MSQATVITPTFAQWQVSRGIVPWDLSGLWKRISEAWRSFCAEMKKLARVILDALGSIRELYASLRAGLDGDVVSFARPAPPWYSPRPLRGPRVIDPPGGW